MHAYVAVEICVSAYESKCECMCACVCARVVMSCFNHMKEICNINLVILYAECKMHTLLFCRLDLMTTLTRLVWLTPLKHLTIRITGPTLWAPSN